MVTDPALPGAVNVVLAAVVLLKLPAGPAL
jgi:hypothetical protein